jgi:AcrR family transcriptional regulator
MAPEDRREQLLDAALRVLVEDGYTGASIEGIARAAGVSRPVVYDHFGDLATLLSALVQREEEHVLEQLAAVVPTFPDERDPDVILEEAMADFLRVVAANPDSWRLMLLPVEGTPDLVRQHVASNREAVLAQVEGPVALGVERRGGPLGIDVELLARSIIKLAEQAARLHLTDPDRFPIERLVRFTREIAAALERQRPAG